MAGARIICLVLLCLSAVINAETKQTEIPPSASVKYEHSTSPPKHASLVHSYQGNSHGHSRVGRQVTSAPATTYSPSEPSGGKKPVKQTTAPQTHSYPPSGGGSGSENKHVKPTSAPQNNSHPTSEVESRLEKEHVYYPTYTGILPDYVYNYRASQSRYRKLLTGLALYNFGMLSQNRTTSEWKDYVPSENEACEFGIRFDEVSKYEEVDIDCRLITDFIWSEKIGSAPELNTTKVVNALDPKFNGDPIEIKPNMRCYMKWGNSSTSARVKDVDCGLLQMYYERSQAATKITTTFLVVVTSFVVLLLG